MPLWIIVMKLLISYMHAIGQEELHLNLCAFWKTSLCRFCRKKHLKNNSLAISVYLRLIFWLLPFWSLNLWLGCPSVEFILSFYAEIKHSNLKSIFEFFLQNMFWKAIVGLALFAMIFPAFRLRARYIVSYILFGCVMFWGSIFYTIKFALQGEPRYENSWYVLSHFLIARSL